MSGSPTTGEHATAAEEDHGGPQQEGNVLKIKGKQASLHDHETGDTSSCNYMLPR